MFGSVPKTLWSRTNPPDDRNRIPLAMRALLVIHEDRRILVDTGVGRVFSAKWEDIYAIDFSQGHLATSLAKHKVTAGDITDVVLTHLHFDHAGGVTDTSGEVPQLTFPAATHHVQRSHWEWALSPSEKDRASFHPLILEVLDTSLKLKLLEGPDELFPGIHLVISNGHTPGLQMVKICGESITLLFCSDLMPTAAHLPLPFIMGYDLCPLTTLEEKRQVLDQAVEQNWILALGHDPVHQAVRVRKGKKNPEIEESVQLD
jgi:glyoxylase-like metal-dependent hydrolase (beta-lactamase superfamily II)